MSGRELPAVATPSTAMHAAVALHRCFPDLSKNVVCVLVAQMVFETGYFDHMYCYSSAGIKARGDDDYCFYATTEHLAPEVAAQWLAKSTPDAPCTRVTERNGKVIVRVSGRHPACKFRAFSSLDDAVIAYVHLLQSRYETAWRRLLASENARQFVQDLHTGGYFTGDEGTYINGIAHLSIRYVTEMPWPLPDEAPDVLTVAGCQGALSALGYDPGPSDGVYGPRTRGAIACFQVAEHLPTTCLFDARTRERLAFAVTNLLPKQTVADGQAVSHTV